MTVALMSLIGTKIGNYEIQSELGRGGMGIVYLGTHPVIGRRVAIKVLHERFSSRGDIVQRFFLEAKAVNDIGHDNVVDVTDFGSIRDSAGRELFYLIMEFLEGESLATRIRRAPLAVAEAQKVLTQCSSALAASHHRRIVHRDVKPENIFLSVRRSERNFVKLLDFGIAKLTEDEASSTTRSGALLGTPMFMSPEQCEGNGRIDHRSDIYSLGVVMYELLTGRPPFIAEGYGELITAHMTTPPPDPTRLNPALAPELCAIALHALEKDRERRFQSMEEFAEALANPEAHLDGWSASPRRWAARRAPDAGTSALTEGVAHGEASLDRPTRGTTLSGSASEIRWRSSLRRGPKMAFGLALLLGLLGFAAFFWHGRAAQQRDSSSRPEPAQTKTPPPAAAVHAGAEEVAKIHVVSDPPGATVFRANRPIGRTPLDLDRKKAEGPFAIELRLADYVVEHREIAPDSKGAISIRMTPLPEFLRSPAKKPRVRHPLPAKLQDPDLDILELP